MFHLLKSQNEMEAFLKEKIGVGKSLRKKVETVNTEEALDETHGEVSRWHEYNKEFLRRAFNSEEVFNDYRKRGYSRAFFSFGESWNTGISDCKYDIEDKVQALEEILEKLPLYTTPSKENNAHIVDPIALLEKVCNRFHLIARQFRKRYGQRPTLEIHDEYDVQDLLHSLLQMDFEDIRAEEHTPSYAGKASRMDFLLKDEQIVVEVKKTRSGLDGKEVGTQLIEDIARYKNHPDCKTLICFVYDPDSIISNPRGIERDLSSEEPMQVKVFIRPR